MPTDAPVPSDLLLPEMELASADQIVRASHVLSQIEAERLGPAKAACHIICLRDQVRELSERINRLVYPEGSETP